MSIKVETLPSDLYFVVVVYNKTCRDSVTCDYLLKKRELGINVIVVDNSTYELNNDKFCVENGWKYISMEGNAGLSKAYNRALEELKNCNGYVIWADDDSKFDSEYIENVLLYLNEFGSQFYVFAPLVFAEEKIYSPNFIGEDGYIRRVNSIEELEGKRISAINSGLVVNLRVYENYRYDIQMFLDYIDHDFCMFCLKSKYDIFVMKRAVIQQNSFFEAKPSIEKLRKRRKIYEKDFIRFVKRNELSIIKGYKKLFLGKIVQFSQGIKKGNP